jgi:multiple sugar transport system permease protein
MLRPYTDYPAKNFDYSKPITMTATAPTRAYRPEREHPVAYAMIAPAALVLTVFVLLPFALAFILSFTDQRLISPNPAQGVGLGNYSELLRVEFITLMPETDAAGSVVLDENGAPAYPRARNILRGDPRYEDLRELTQIDLFGSRILVAAGDPRFIRALLNNVFFTVTVVPIQTAFALFLAILVNQKIKGATVFRTLYFSPVVTTMAVVAVLWFFLYNPDQGLINAILRLFNIGPFEWLNHPASAMPAIMLLSIWQGVGFQMVIYLAGLQDIPDVLYEAATVDGATRWQQFRFITLPGLRNTTIFIAISTTILSFRLFTQVEVMTGGTGGPEDSTVTMMLHLVEEGFRSQRVGYAAAIAVVFIIIVLSITLVQRRIFREAA